MNNGHSRPNFLVFVVDQMHSGSLGCNGNPDVQTPNIDSVAQQGVTFSRCYCNNSVCMPSRSSMITGLTPRQHGCITNGTLLPEHIPTISGALADAGYRTHAVGKLHLQPFSVKATADNSILSWESRELWDNGQITSLPSPYYGFQTTDFVGGHVSYNFGDYTNWLRKHHPGVHELYSRNKAYEAAGQSWKMDVPPELHYNHWIADKTIDFLKSIRTGESFFLWCSFPDPHHPFAASKPYSDMYDPASLAINPTWNLREDPCEWMADRPHPSPNLTESDLRADMAQTYGMITHIDNNIGRIMDSLRASGLDDNTVIVFMSDHGEYLGSHHLLYKSFWPWEELLRIPFIWRAPSRPSPSHSTDLVVDMLDFAPTVLDYAGVDQDELNMRKPAANSDWPGLPGRSLRPAIDSGEAMDERPAIVEYDEDWQAGTMVRARTIIHEQWKLTVFPRLGKGILSDLQEDPHETRNLWDSQSHAQIRMHLTKRLLEELIWSDPLNGPRICGA